MLSLIVSSLLALAQAAPHTAVPTKNTPAIPANLARDLGTAAAFRKTVTGPPEILANWTTNDVCEWYGFYCVVNPDTGLLSLASIDFNNFFLTGNLKLTNFVEKLPDLAIFHANNNSFSGPIPNLKGNKYLYEIDLGNNAYSGSFPKSLLTNRDVVYLDIGNNQLSGPLPPNLFSSLPKLEQIYLRVNRLSGPIPDDFANSKALQAVSLLENEFSGPFPASLTKVKTLVAVSIATNNVTGPIPVGFGALPKLEAVDLSYNQLTGTVPEDLCASKSLKYLDVAGNKLDPRLGPACQKAKEKGILNF